MSATELWVYLCSNMALVVTAVIGQCLYLRNKSQGAASGAAPG